MKGVILTNQEEYNFIVEACRFNKCYHDVEVTTVTRFPDRYGFGISFMYTKKVPAFHVNNHPWFNFHPGPLPMYKGRNLCYHAIMNDEKEFGATIHYMDEDFDTGDIIEVRKFSVLSTDTAETLSENTLKAARQLFIQYFPRILAGEKFPRIPNIDGKYYKKEPIVDYINVPEKTKKEIRATTYKEFVPIIDIHGVEYEVVKK